jgi:cytochrome c oxidase subunit IV
MSQHIVSVRTNWNVFIALMVLLVATVVFAYLPMGRLHLATAMVIATVKAVLIILYFMHVRFSNRLTWVFSASAFVWLSILIVLSLSDYLSRGWLAIDGK